MHANQTEKPRALVFELTQMTFSHAPSFLTGDQELVGDISRRRRLQFFEALTSEETIKDRSDDVECRATFWNTGQLFEGNVGAACHGVYSALSWWYYALRRVLILFLLLAGDHGFPAVVVDC
jgi:hypothetical protein